MSRAESGERLLLAAISLGVDQGVGAMSLQGIATTAGVSKALVLYHFGDKTSLYAAIVERLGERSAERLHRAAIAADALLAWRALVHAEADAGELALLAALGQEAELQGSAVVPQARAVREERSTALASAILAAVGLAPRVPSSLLGRVLVRHLDGLATAAAHAAFPAKELDAELDTFALALLGLGR